MVFIEVRTSPVLVAAEGVQGRDFLSPIRTGHIWVPVKGEVFIAVRTHQVLVAEQESVLDLVRSMLRGLKLSLVEISFLRKRIRIRMELWIKRKGVEHSNF